jgi:peptidoglycan/xylan/chitin deacetylase (PgdA/CDA1 family)
MYHSVKVSERERFARQMEMLLRLAYPLAGDCARGDLAEGRHHAIVTFDDGYESVLRNALPEMRGRGIPATMFIPTRYIGGRPEWIIDPGHRDHDEAVITGAALRRLHAEGVIVGSHTVNHHSLDGLPERDVRFELTESRRVLGGLLASEITLFALPFGAGNPDVLRLAAESGYTRIFLGDPVWDHWEPEMLAIGRIGVSADDWRLEFRLKTLGAYQWMPLAIAAKRGLRQRWLRLLRGRDVIKGGAVVAER